MSKRAYAWVITDDRFYKKGDPSSDVGTNGPNGHTQTIGKIMKDGEPFRMYDDDGKLYYEGYMLHDDDSDGFEPLDDFGMPNSGCTSITYYSKGKKLWETL